MDKEQDTFIHRVQLRRDLVPSFDEYPFTIPAVRSLSSLKLDRPLTLLVGDNGSGKSTLVEGIAVAAGFNPEGGSRNFNFATRESHSALHEFLTLVRGSRSPKSGFFFRAESFFNVATEVEELGGSVGVAYGSSSLHEQSHGESFLSLIMNRFVDRGLYILDEPEAALSIHGNLAFMRRMHDLIAGGAQFLVATHSPILMGFPNARIYELSEAGFDSVAYEETSQYRLMRSFLENRESFLHHLFDDGPSPSG